MDVYPSEIENCLLNHPLINEAVVFGVDINDYEQAICAWVKLVHYGLLSEEDIINYCKDYLIDYKVPKYIKFVENIPANNLGKHLRGEIKIMYKNELAQKSKVEE